MEEPCHNILGLIGDIYESSYKPEHWTKVLEGICLHLKATSAGMFFKAPGVDSVNWMYGYNIPSAVKFAYNNGMSRFDPGIKLMDKYPEGETFDILAGLSDHQLAPTYQKLILKPAGIHHIYGFNIVKDNGLQVAIGIHRSPDCKPFIKDDADVLSMVHPHLKRSVKIHREFARTRLEHAAMSEGLANLALGIIILDADQNVSHTNPVADAILDSHPAIGVSNSRIYASTVSENKKLQDAILRASTDASGPGNHSIGLRDPGASHPLAISVAAYRYVDPLINFDLTRSAENSVLIYLCDPSSEVLVSPESLCQRYALTQAEASIAIGLATGLSIRQLAKSNGTSYETVKSQVKQVFQKTGVNRQADLVGLVVKNQMCS